MRLFLLMCKAAPHGGDERGPSYPPPTVPRAENGPAASVVHPPSLPTVSHPYKFLHGGTRAHVQYYLSVFALNLTLWFWRWRCSGANTHRVLRAFDSAGPSLVCAFGAARLPRNVWNEATACTWFARRGAACVRAVSADVPTRRQKGGLHQTCLVVRGT
jgi:hypothetical protein